MSYRSSADVLAALDLSTAQAAAPFFLSVGPLRIAVKCAGALRDTLVSYFDEALTGEGPADIHVHVVQGQGLLNPPVWVDWTREPGKTGRKDAVWDLSDGRLIYKRRTGVTFLQSRTALVAFGPVDAHPNQVINFINTQVLGHCQRDGWQICHAAAVTNGTRTLAIAGLSGGGKSTSVLRMMDVPGTRFVSNDRLMVHAGAPARALGIPKQPRINPGTILGNPRLQGMLTADRRAALLAMPSDDLWALEDKHDLIIAQVFGRGRVQYAAPLTDFWVLNWARDAVAPTVLNAVHLPDRPDLLAAIMKGAGPFYHDADGVFHGLNVPLDPPAYLKALHGVRVHEVAGRVDFDAIATFGCELLHG